MNKELRHRLMELADKYETANFLIDDPAQFMHRYSLTSDIEIAGLIASTLAFGQRPKILEKLEYICRLMKDSPSQWIKGQEYEEAFPSSDKKFYRFYSYKDLRWFFYQVRRLLSQYGTIGDYMIENHQRHIHPLEAIVSAFSDCPTTKHLIPKDTHSCCKRVNMYLRWMVRDNSPVDMGLWNFIDKKELIIPADTHVMQEALRLGIIKKASSSLSKAKEITDAMRLIWSEDPCKGDFALFGWGVNHPSDVKSIQKGDIK